MLQMILTALAGVACGIVAMRLWQGWRADTALADTAPGDAAPGDGAGVSSAASGLALRKSLQSGPRMMLAGAAILALIATGIFAFREEGAAPSSAISSVPGAAAGAPADANLADVDTMISALAARLEKNPDDGEGFRMLGWSYLMTDRPKEALAPYRRARELLPENASVHAGYGEVLVALADRKVTAEAKAAFDKAIALDPAEPRARYFEGLYKAQNGQEKAALEDWIALVNSASADAPWLADVRAEAMQLASKLGLDVSGRMTGPAQTSAVAGDAARPPALDPATVRAAQQLSPTEQAKMIDGMVEGLAARLRADPSDAQGWARLVRSRMVRGQVDQAKADLATARRALAKDSKGIALVEASAKEAGVPGA